MAHRLLVPETLNAAIDASGARTSTASSELRAKLASVGALDVPIARRELLNTIETLQSALVTTVCHAAGNTESALDVLAARLDKLAQQISAVNARTAALERKDSKP